MLIELAAQDASPSGVLSSVGKVLSSALQVPKGAAASLRLNAESRMLDQTAVSYVAANSVNGNVRSASTGI